MESSIIQASTKPTNWKRLKEQVESWIQSEQHCVTAQRISQTLNVSRMLGSQLLKEILEANKNHQVSTCTQTREDNVIVFRLNTTTEAPRDLSTASIFALSSVETTESVETSHERDMVQWRDMVRDKIIPQKQITAIAPANEIEDEKSMTSMPSDMQVGIGGKQMTTHSSAYVPRSGESKQSVKAPKMMTASSFFGSQTNKKKSHKSANKTKKDLEKIPASSKSVVSKSTLSRKENHKPSEMNRSVPETKIGNADDFVADEEESDDEMAPVKKVPPFSTKEKNRQLVKPSAEPAILPVRGSMDSFATKVSKNVGNEDNKSRQKRRRKKLVEKTTMVGGYLRTETVTVWEDIPTDEENEDEEKRKVVAKKIPASRPKNSNNMKQKSLMGFFAKK